MDGQFIVKDESLKGKIKSLNELPDTAKTGDRYILEDKEVTYEFVKEEIGWWMRKLTKKGTKLDDISGFKGCYLHY